MGDAFVMGEWDRWLWPCPLQKKKKKKKVLQNQHSEIYDTVAVGVNIHKSKPQKDLFN